MNLNISWINSESTYIVAPKKKKKKKKSVEYALYDLEGKQIIKSGTGVSNIFAPSEGIAVVTKNESIGFYDLNNHSFTPADDSRVYLPFKDGFSMSYDSKSKSDFYIVDKKGNKVSENYDEIAIASNRFIVRKSGNYGLITKQGQEIVPTECLGVMDANKGLFGIKTGNGKFGYIDENGNTVVPFAYDGGSAFVGDYAVVSKTPEGTFAKKSGIIDKENTIIIPLNYSKVCGYVDDSGKLQVWVADNGNYSEVDNASFKSAMSPRLIPTDYVDMKTTEIGIVVKNTNGAYGLIRNGENVIPCSVANEELVSKVYTFMTSRNIAKVNAIDAYRIAAWTNDARNTFSIKDTISDNIWDF